VFPLVDGKRSTQQVGRTVVSSALTRVDTSASEAARDESRWYRHYIDHFRELTRLAAGSNGGLIAGDGLAAIHDVMRFRGSGSETSVNEALSSPREGHFSTVTVDGTGPADAAGLVLHDGELPRRGDEVESLLARWDDDGVTEPSATEALRLVQQNEQWLDMRDVTVVALGASAELSPVPALLQWGCHVVAVDLPGRARWQALLDLARRSPGRLTLPVRDDHAVASDDALADLAGADVVTETPEIVDWLLRQPGQFVMGDYVYAPGSQHLRTSVAVDGIVEAVTRERPDVGLAYLATPTDCYAVPTDVVAASQQGLARGSRLAAAARGLAGNRVFRPNYELTQVLITGRRFGVYDGLIGQQGASYALAKRVQRWRATTARQQDRWVSINVAPPTRTASVLTNPVLRAGYGGAHRFGVQVFTPRASRQVMAVLLVHDLRNPSSTAHPQVPLEDSMDLMVAEAVHGGMWRAPYAPRSVLGFAAAAGRLRR
jgi:hypothetical protein